MPRKQLDVALTTLHEQLTGGDPLDQKDREHLTQVLGDIRTALDAGPNDEGEDQDIVADLNETIARFQVSHPTITAGLQQIADLLRRL